MQRIVCSMDWLKLTLSCCCCINIQNVTLEIPRSTPDKIVTLDVKWIYSESDQRSKTSIFSPGTAQSRGCGLNPFDNSDFMSSKICTRSGWVGAQGSTLIVISLIYLQTLCTLVTNGPRPKEHHGHQQCTVGHDLDKTPEKPKSPYAFGSWLFWMARRRLTMNLCLAPFRAFRPLRTP